MRVCAVTDNSGEVRILDSEERSIEPHEVRVEVHATGVCHTDLAVAQRLEFPRPLILGHEASGQVVEVGANVANVRLGDRVITTFAPGCGDCPSCRRGRPTQCLGSTGTSGRAGYLRDGTPLHALMGLGTFSESIIIDGSQAIGVQTDLPPQDLAVIGCAVTTGVGAALWTAHVQPGSSVAIFGCGGVGHFIVQGARIAGASRIFAIDPVSSKVEDAQGAGATDGIDPNSAGAADQIREATGGIGVDFAFDAVGHPLVVSEAISATRRGGTTVVVGMSDPTATLALSPYSVMRDEKVIRGSFYGSSNPRSDFARLIQMIEAGQLDVHSAVTIRVGLQSISAAAEALIAGTGIRHVIVDPKAEQPEL